MSDNLDAGAPSSIDENYVPTKESLRALAQAHRLWALAFSQCMAIVMQSLTQDTPATLRMEYLCRCVLTDCIAWVCDGSRLGLFDLGLANVRNVVGSAEAAQDMEHLREARAQDDALQSGQNPGSGASTTYSVLEAARERMGTQAREVLSNVLKREAVPDSLFRVLVLEDGWEAAAARDVLEAANKAVA